MNFESMLAVGSRNEEYIRTYLEGRGHKITDLTKEAEYQKKDIDFLVEDTKGNSTTLEVKSDTKIHKNGNFFFEEGFDRKSGFRKGWFNYCEAEYLCFYDGIAGQGYILDFAATKEIVKQEGRKISWFNNTDNCNGYAYLLPLGIAKEKGLIVHEWRN